MSLCQVFYVDPGAGAAQRVAVGTGKGRCELRLGVEILAGAPFPVVARITWRFCGNRGVGEYFEKKEVL